jgi:hypothetical protein
MKINYKTVLVLLVILAASLVVSTSCMAADNKTADNKTVVNSDENIWAEDQPTMDRPFKLNDEMIQRMLNKLRETDPNKAKELIQLRKDNPEKFQGEFRKVMHGQFMKNMGQRRDQAGGQRPPEPPKEPCMAPNMGPNSHPWPPVRPQEAFGHEGGNEREAWMARMQEEFTGWMEKNYPDEAKKLAKLKGENPGLYMRQLAIDMKKYRRIQEVSEENPALAEVLKQNLTLNEKCDQLLKQISTAKNDADKKTLTTELEKVLGSKFDLIVKRKQMEYEGLHQKLESLKVEVQKSETNVEKWKGAEFKNSSVKARLEELLNKQEKFEWN